LSRKNHSIATITDKRFLDTAYHEVTIDIGRDGEFIFDDGRHRFVIAKLLGLDEIPVRVLVRHKKWQQIRGYILSQSSIDEVDDEYHKYLDHPDIRAAMAAREEVA
jgi:hypothetical protein